MARSEVPTLSEQPSSALRERLAGRYELLGLLGSGGMGSVYRARDLELDELVALKMLRRELVDAPEALERFRREVKLARRVTHPNVARTFDIGEHGGERFLTMELIDGEPLSTQLARQGRLAVARAVEIACAVCAGLSAAHSVGIVHRDLKPDNVMLSHDGRVVITDFGIARSHLEEPGGMRTLDGVVGTPAYMAPEQVEGRRDVDVRADVYALGVMLFEMLTGGLPFNGATALAIAAARLTETPPDPRERVPQLPDEIARVVLGCLERDRARRIASADAVASMLAASAPTLSAVSVVPATPSQPVPTTPSAQRTGPGDKTVAVLPFRNAGPPDDEYLADGLTDELIDTLSMTRGLRVRPRSSVAQLVSGQADARAVGRDLGVEVVVEGSVRRMGDNARISARVVSVADGFQLWAKRFDRARSDLLVVSDEVAQAIAQALTVEPGAEAREAPSDPEAIDLYLRARAAVRGVWQDAAEHGVELFEQAAARAPDDPTILAGYARACARLAFFRGDDPELGQRARRIAARALALAPDRAEALFALAAVSYSEGDLVQAAGLLRKALAKAPMLAEGHELAGEILVEVGRPAEGIARFRTAQSIDDSLRTHFSMARGHALLGDWSRVQEIVAAPFAAGTSGPLGFVVAARFALWSPEPQAWIALLDSPAFEAAPPLPPVLFARAVRDVVKSGRIEAHHRQLVVALESSRDSARFGPLKHQVTAELFAFAGERDSALEHIEAATRKGLHDLTWLDRCPPLAALREEPRFAQARSTVAARAARVLDAWR